MITFLGWLGCFALAGIIFGAWWLLLPGSLKKLRNAIEEVLK